MDSTPMTEPRSLYDSVLFVSINVRGVFERDQWSVGQAGINYGTRMGVGIIDMDDKGVVGRHRKALKKERGISK